MPHLSEDLTTTSQVGADHCTMVLSASVILGPSGAMTSQTMNEELTVTSLNILSDSTGCSGTGGVIHIYGLLYCSSALDVFVL